MEDTIFYGETSDGSLIRIRECDGEENEKINESMTNTLSEKSKDSLIKMLALLKVSIPMEYADVFLIFAQLNTEEKLREFETWIRSKMDGETFQVTAEEIMHMANKIGGELTVDE